MQKPPKPIHANYSESTEAPVSTEGSASDYSADELTGVKMTLGGAKLSKQEATRFSFFRGEMQFVKDLTDISESLRYVRTCATVHHM
jgi:hypothetical protein